MIYGDKFYGYGVINESLNIFKKKDDSTIKKSYKYLSDNCPLITAISEIDSYEDFDEDPILYFKFNKNDDKSVTIKEWNDLINNNINKLKEIKSELAENLNGKSYKDASIQLFEIEINNKNRSKIINKLKYDLNSVKNELNIYNKNINEDKKSYKYNESKYFDNAIKIINDEKIVKQFIKYENDLLSFRIKLEEALIYAFDISIKEIDNLLNELNK